MARKLTPHRPRGPAEPADDDGPPQRSALRMLVLLVSAIVAAVLVMLWGISVGDSLLPWMVGVVLLSHLGLLVLLRVGLPHLADRREPPAVRPAVGPADGPAGTTDAGPSGPSGPAGPRQPGDRIGLEEKRRVWREGGRPEPVRLGDSTAPPSRMPDPLAGRRAPDAAPGRAVAAPAAVRTAAGALSDSVGQIRMRRRVPSVAAETTAPPPANDDRRGD